MNAKQAVLKKIKDGTFALFTDAQIAQKLKLGKRESLALRDMLNSLCREGELLHDARYRFGTAEQFGAKVGKFVGNERGFGFFVPNDGTDDWFIPHRATGGALHGDCVLAIPAHYRSDDEGEIVAIIDRGYREIVGTYHRVRNAGYLTPDEKKYNADIYIPAGKQQNCRGGMKCVAKITSFRGNTPTGEIIEILGEDGDFFVEETALIRSHSLREEFPREVENAAEEQAQNVPSAEDLKGRTDLRKELIITVDGEDTRDIDDAISVCKKGETYELGVHIADVSHYVKRGGIIDKEAFKRGTSVYFPDRVLPMLPRALSNNICSLNESVDRLTLSCFMTIDKHGNVIRKRMSPSVINSRHRMTYTAVTAIYEGDRNYLAKYPDLIDFINTAVELTELLKKKRATRGGVEMDIKEAKILYEDGKIIIPDYKRTISHEMIEQFMVLANESVAELMTEKKMPFIYRVHESPTAEKAEGFAEFLSEAGLHVPFRSENVSPQDYRNVLNELKDSPLYSLVNRVMLRSMMKAAYSPENIGHFGLASECYCHFTSPIRRYPDLCIHRIIKESFINPEGTKAAYKQFVHEAAVQSSETEKNAAEAERDVDALYCTKYMQEKIGEEYFATVSGVASYGLFAELDNTIEGLVPIDSLPEDYYELIDTKYLLKGTKNSFRLGDRIKIKVVGVDWGARRTQFQYLEKIENGRKV